MVVTQDELTKINKVQVDILKEVDRVCRLLNIQYYMVHGSLLGTVLTGKFMPFDDDIDIAMHRKDYEKFISEAPKNINSKYFIQTNKTDREYPVSFMKIRDNETTYIVENIRDLKINHGIYIDVFPIDYCVAGNVRTKMFNVKNKILSLRIGCKITRAHTSVPLKLKQILSCIIYPSWKRAVDLKEKLAKAAPKNDRIRLTGGKPSENGIPAKWFEDAELFSFEGVDVNVPKMYREYLTKIYGDYKNCFLAEGKMDGEDKVEINACVVDTEKAYTEYV